MDRKVKIPQTGLRINISAFFEITEICSSSHHPELFRANVRPNIFYDYGAVELRRWHRQHAKSDLAPCNTNAIFFLLFRHIPPLKSATSILCLFVAVAHKRRGQSFSRHSPCQPRSPTFPRESFPHPLLRETRAIYLHRPGRKHIRCAQTLQ